MFWKKVACDGCNARVRASRAIYYRGSYFCGPACRESWRLANPPLVARGDRATLLKNALATIDAALAGFARWTGRKDLLTTAAEQFVPMLGAINARQEAEERADAKLHFIQYAAECMPIFNALGFTEEASVLESIDFASGDRPHEIINALQRARARAAQN